ncbi:large-conductance mechanosensitive channel protein MscL [Streptobacillus ratti]|uniref:large-conductance mechanosensitive channel protein MscL n=1 Tax=Streptobacillus ratti TaxID=1720557 RepID=UPI0009322F7E|nr:large-conductance mechanosensitive channel protein MscL [Streptobacillus ratti]
MLKEFKDFIAKGNIVDLAVGVIIGGAFGKIVASLVNDIIMPFIGLILGNINFKTLQIILKPAEGETPALSINYGMFIQNIVDFLIIALVIFIVLKGLMKLKREKPVEETVPAEPVLTKDQELLVEIRDLLKK